MRCSLLWFDIPWEAANGCSSGREKAHFWVSACLWQGCTVLSPQDCEPVGTPGSKSSHFCTCGIWKGTCIPGVLLPVPRWGTAPSWLCFDIWQGDKGKTAGWAKASRGCLNISLRWKPSKFNYLLSRSKRKHLECACVRAEQGDSP